MIQDRKSLRLYLNADRFALGKEGCSAFFTIDKVWRFEILLRKYEYFKNRHLLCESLFRIITGARLKALSYRLGFSIPVNCFGPGLRINHHGLLIVNSECKIGKWCDIHQGVNIGDNGEIIGGEYISRVPSLGNYVFIGPGSKIFGDITVGDEVRIGANSIVNKNVCSNMTVYGPILIANSI